MKYREALIAWTPNTNDIRIGPLIAEGQTDWTHFPVRYQNTAGAAYVAVREIKDELMAALGAFKDFTVIVARDSVPAASAYEEFLKIDEFRDCLEAD